MGQTDERYQHWSQREKIQHGVSCFHFTLGTSRCLHGGLHSAIQQPVGGEGTS